MDSSGPWTGGRSPGWRYVFGNDAARASRACSDRIGRKTSRDGARLANAESVKTWVLSVLFLTPSTAWALRGVASEVPNADNPELQRLGQPCIICHTSVIGDGTFNRFGADLEDIRDWSVLFDMDSDGDGQTNGFELGDPDGLWTRGSTPERTENLSFPGDSSSISDAPGGTPDAGVTDAGVTDVGTDMPNDAGAMDPDGAVPQDASPPFDVGGGPDSGGSADAGAVPSPITDAGTSEDMSNSEDLAASSNSGGDGCHAGPYTRTPPHFLLWMVVFVLGLGRVKNRRPRCPQEVQPESFRPGSSVRHH